MKNSTAINQYLKEQASLDLLRFITCGSVDDGKSTLIGRMLYESQMIFDDQVASLKKDSQKHGTQGEDIDFALLVDGLSACLLYTSPSPRDLSTSRMPSSA